MISRELGFLGVLTLILDIIIFEFFFYTFILISAFPKSSHNLMIKWPKSHIGQLLNLLDMHC